MVPFRPTRCWPVPESPPCMTSRHDLTGADALCSTRRVHSHEQPSSGARRPSAAPSAARPARADDDSPSALWQIPGRAEWRRMARTQARGHSAGRCLYHQALEGGRVHLLAHAPVAEKIGLVTNELPVKEPPLRVAERGTKDTNVVHLANEATRGRKWHSRCRDGGDRGWSREWAIVARRPHATRHTQA